MPPWTVKLNVTTAVDVGVGSNDREPDIRTNDRDGGTRPRSNWVSVRQLSIDRSTILKE
jgi:hypothetical protein